MDRAYRGSLSMASCCCTGLCLLPLVAGCPFPPHGADGALEHVFDFGDGLQKWSAEVADYPVEIEDDLQFDWGRDDLPPELGVEGTGLRIESVNRPDDAFTFIKRRFGPEDGVVAGGSYRVSFEILVASNAPSDCVGVGGAPGESVYLKAGASAVEPKPELDEEETHVGLNIDIGDQAGGGPAASVVGDMANGIPCDLIPNLEEAPYALLFRTHEHETEVTASDAGELWALIGTDSGFESLTRVYYLRVKVTLVPAFHP